MESKEWETAMEILGDAPAPGLRRETVEDTPGITEYEPLPHVHSSLSLLRGLVLEALDNRSQAVEAYTEALYRNVNCFEALDRLMSHHLLTATEEYALLEALPFTEQCGPDADSIKFLYATKMKQYGRQSSITSGLRVMERIAKCTEYTISEAEHFYYQCNFRKCHEMTSKILDSDPFHHACLPIHLACQVELQDTNGLFYLAHKLVDSYPAKAVSWFAVGCYYYLEKNNENARRYFGKASQLEPYFGPAWIGFGHSFAAEGEHDQAMAAYCTAARLMSGCHLPLLYIGMEYVQTNNPSMAKQYFYQAYDICDHDPLVLHEMGVVHFQVDDFEEAESCFQRALGLCEPQLGSLLIAPTWEPTLCNLARTYQKMGRYEEAVQCYERAQVICPTSGPTYAGLGYASQCLGDDGRAIDCYHKALSLNAEDSFSTQMLKKALMSELSQPLVLDFSDRTSSSFGGSSFASSSFIGNSSQRSVGMASADTSAMDMSANSSAMDMSANMSMG